jgi:hypothetical protein
MFLPMMAARTVMAKNGKHHRAFSSRVTPPSWTRRWAIGNVGGRADDDHRL